MGQHFPDMQMMMQAAGAPPLTGIAAGVRLATKAGFVAVGELRPGDAILTRDSGYRALRTVVPLGFLPCGTPDGLQLWLRPDHGVLARDAAGEEALLPARLLFSSDRPRLARHLVLSIACDRHEVLCAEGGWIESAPIPSGLPARPRIHPLPAATVEPMRNFRVAGGGGRA